MIACANSLRGFVGTSDGQAEEEKDNAETQSARRYAELLDERLGREMKR
jgi:hypothetical protein